VETGAVQSVWKVCRKCKLEVSDKLFEELKEKVLKKEKLEEDQAQKDKDELDAYQDLFGYNFLGIK
jgi:hypothetical protein